MNHFVRKLTLGAGFFLAAQINNVTACDISGYAGAPDELKAKFLFPAARECLLKENGLSRLKSVCKGWKEFLEKSDVPDEFLSLEIEEADYYDSQMGEKLKACGWVKHLTIHAPALFPTDSEQHFKNSLNVVLEGLQNKPHLKIFTWVGDLDVCLLFGLQEDTGRIFREEDPTASGSPLSEKFFYPTAYDDNPLYFVTLPHLKFFENLTTFTVTGCVEGDRNWGGFFKVRFMNFENFPKLQEYKYLRETLERGTPQIFKRPQPQT